MRTRNIAQFALGPLVAAVLGVVTLPVITWYFDQGDIGRISMMQITLSFGTLLFSLGLDQAYVREFHEVDNKPALLKESLIPGLILLSLALGTLLVFGGQLAKLLFDVASLELSLLVAVALLATFFSRFLSLILRMRERGLAFSMSIILPKLLFLLIVGTYVVTGSNRNLTGLVSAHTVSITFVLLVVAWSTRGELLSSLYERVDIHRLKAMLGFGLPLIAGGVAFWGLTATDKVLLRSLSNYEELGLYSVSVSFASAATILQSIFSTVWAPTVYKWASLNKGLEKISEVSRYVLLCVIVLFCLSGLFSWVVPYLLPDNYTRVQWVFISCLGYPLLYTLSETTKVGIGISRKSSLSMLAAIIAFSVNVIGNFLLIPRLGAEGAAVSTCIAFLIFFVLRTEFSIYLWRPMPRLSHYSFSFFLVLGATASTLFGGYIDWIVYLYWLVLLLVSCMFFKKELLVLKRYVFMQLKGKNRGSARLDDGLKGYGKASEIPGEVEVQKKLDLL